MRTRETERRVMLASGLVIVLMCLAVIIGWYMNWAWAARVPPSLPLLLLLAYALWQANRMRISEERYSTAVRGARAALWDWDLRNDKVFWAGYAPELWGAKDFKDIPSTREAVMTLIHPDDLPQIDAILKKQLEKSSNFDMEYRKRTLDGREVWVQSRGEAIKSGTGEPTRMTGTVIDITERKLAEQELRRSNRELEQFAYVASHDLKAPLRAIDNLAKWIAEDLADVMTPDARDKINLLRSRVGRLENLLEDILRYSRAGRGTEAPEKIDTGALARQIGETVAADGKFKVTVEEGMPVVTSPRTHLEQVFTNLIVNAVKHHDRGAGEIRVAARSAAPYYEFSVTDDGPGIPPEFHEKVFQMFQTLQPRDKTEGSGLGMSIVKKLVEWKGGKVWIVSEAGKRGTGIHFQWPVVWGDGG